MKRIGIFLGSDPGRGGLFQYSLAVAEALSALPREGHAIIAAFFNPAWVAYIEPIGLRSIRLSESGREPFTLGRIWRSACLPITSWRRFFWRFDPVARALSKEGCDLWLFPAQDHWSYLAPVPAVATIHDLMHRYEPRFPEVSKWGRYFVREYRFRNICHFATAVLVDSELGRKHVSDSYGMSRDRLFSLPYIPPRYVFDAVVPAGFDERYRLPPRYLFYPAQFWSHKNHDRLLQAVAIVRRSCPDVFIVLAGQKHHQYDRLVRRVAELGLGENVMFTGYVPDADLPELYRRARALVMPTFFGPTNIPPLEAFACGCPAAVSNIYGMPEQVGDAALLFDPSDVSEMAAVIQKLWMDDALCRQLIARGYDKTASWGQKQFSEALNQLVTQIGSPAPTNRQVHRADSH